MISLFKFFYKQLLDPALQPNHGKCRDMTLLLQNYLRYWKIHHCRYMSLYSHVSICFRVAVLIRYYTLLFQRNNKICCKGLVCKVSSVASYQTRWYNKIIFKKGYLVPWNFSWIGYCKMVTPMNGLHLFNFELNSFLRIPLIMLFLEYTSSWQISWRYYDLCC